MDISPFPKDYRGAGVLLHVTSLPTAYGIGDFGPVAKSWIDQLADAGQSVWQVLPLGPVGFGYSPYQLVSTFAGNEYLISPDGLIADGLLQTSGDCGLTTTGGVDYDAVKLLKGRLVEQAWQKFKTDAPSELRTIFERFCRDNAEWLDDYGLFICLRHQFGKESFLEWPDEFAKRDPTALATAREELADGIDRVRFGQFVVFRQMEQLRLYANSKGVSLIGDLPFFAAPNSCDVWSSPELFLVDEHLQPTFVAGVPPDYFSPEGQHWGNPLYRWEKMRAANYGWWIRRFRMLLKTVDIIRLDHFRAFAAAWHIPASAKTALEGTWVAGPGAHFFEAMIKEFGALPFLAEDLGMITPDVTALLNQYQLTGMRVLQFAFNGDKNNAFLPQNFVHNTVAYTATHDNDTTYGWYKSLGKKERQLVLKGLQQPKLKDVEVAGEMIRQTWASKAALAITPLQDLLNLDSEHRMNVPGKAEGNWTWACTPEMLDPVNFRTLKDLTKNTKRATSSPVSSD